MPRTSLFGAAAALLLLVAAGCGNDEGDSRADIKADLSETLQRGDDGFDKATADCFADLVIDAAGLDQLKDVDLSADEPPAELKDEIITAAQRLPDECDAAAPGG